MKPEIITEDQAFNYLEDLFYGKTASSLYDFHFPMIFLYKGNLTINGNLDSDWFENSIKHLAEYDFALIIIDGNLTVNGLIKYDRGIPIIYTTGEIVSENKEHILWEQ